jgi:hypothetical protein
MRGEFRAVSALGVGLLAGLGLLVPVARSDARSPTISPSEIHEGMKGYGLTVFKGTEPERFDVEVIGVLHNFRPSQELILMKTPHPRLNVTKSVQGMSGSPIYLDGRLAGAYAYSLRNFSVEPIAGVTPIGPMLSELHRPIPAGFWPPEGGSPINGAPPLSPPGHPVSSLSLPSPFSPLGGNRFEGAPGSYDLGEHEKEMVRRLGPRDDPSQSFVPAATPLLISGVGPRTAAYMHTLLEPLGLEAVGVGGGEAPRQPGDPTRFVDGGSLGVWLARGDMSMMGTGTVTHVEGDKLCGFGHPMLGGGDSALPASLARILWIYASSDISYKVAESIGSLGALVQDRPSSVVVDQSKTAPTFPVDVAVTGVDGAFKKNWHMDVAQDRFMSSGLTASALGAAVEETVSERRDVTWHLSSQVTLRSKSIGATTLSLEDFGIAVGGMPDASDLGRAAIVRAVGDVMNNPWEDARIESVKSTMSVSYDREMWHLRGVETSDDTVDAGSHVKLTAHLVPFTGPATTRTIDVAIPESLAGKDVELEVIPGYEVPRDVASPESLPELLANEVRQTLPPRSLVVQIKLDEQGVAFRGHVAEALPSFAYDTLRPAHSDVAPEPLNSYVRTVTSMDRYVEGRDKIRIKVRQRMR